MCSFVCTCECRCLWRWWCWLPWSWRYSWFWATSVWVLRIELRSSVGALSTFNYWFFKKKLVMRKLILLVYAKTAQGSAWHRSLLSFFLYLKWGQDKAFNFYEPLCFRSRFLLCCLILMKYFNCLRYETWNFFMFMCKSYFFCHYVERYFSSSLKIF